VWANIDVDILKIVGLNISIFLKIWVLKLFCSLNVKFNPTILIEITFVKMSINQWIKMVPKKNEGKKNIKKLKKTQI
jgi:hypothetical protein